MTNRPIIAALGRVKLDFIGVVPAFPERTGPVEVDEISIQVGGSGALAVAAAAHLGCQARFACKLADDFLSKFILDALRKAGIETHGVLAPHKRLSGIEFTALCREPDKRMSFFSRGDVGPFAEGDLDLERFLYGASAVLIDGTSPTTMVQLAELAQAQGVPVVFDASDFGPEVGELVALSDVLICSERLATELTHSDNLEQSLIELQKMGPGAAIITLGDSGSLGLHGDQLVNQPAHPVESVDSEGAGSVYHGAFTAALLAQLPFAECMEFASVAAGLSCTTFGAWAGIPPHSRVVETVRNRGE